MSKVDAVKKLREITGMGLMECKTALDSCNWDATKALEYLKEHIVPSNKPVGAGAIFSYVHHNQLIGVLLELHCGTDFVAKSSDFQTLGNALAIHVAAMDPIDVNALLKQPYLKDDGISVEDFIKVFAGRFNEPIKVARFKRFILGIDNGN